MDIELENVGILFKMSKKEARNLVGVLDSNLIGWANSIKNEMEFLIKIRKDYKYTIIKELSIIFSFNYGIDDVLNRYILDLNKSPDKDL